MDFEDTIKLSLTGLKTNKVRTLLTILGIVIGIAAVIVVMSAGESIRGFILSQVNAFGSDYIEVEIKVPNTSQTSAENAGGLATGVNITTLKIEDAEAILEHPNISSYYAGILSQEIASYGGEIKKTFLFGVSSAFLEIDPGELAEGRFFSDSEDKSLAKVVVLGHKVKDRLFGDSDAVGINIKINKENYRVIGIMEERGAMAFFDMDNLIFIPVRTLQKRIMGIDYINFIFAKMGNPDLAAPTSEDVVKIMRDQHDITDPDKDDFAVVSSEEAMDMVDTIMGGVSLLLIAIAAISLIVGGVGIMNIMYVSIAERTFEIGLRKAVGATKKNILWQFLWEAMFITIAGGIIGIILGVAMAFVIALGAQSQGFEWEFSISIMGIILAFGISGLIGLIFGLYPARRAANLNIIDALRFE